VSDNDKVTWQALQNLVTEHRKLIFRDTSQLAVPGLTCGME